MPYEQYADGAPYLPYGVFDTYAQRQQQYIPISTADRNNDIQSESTNDLPVRDVTAVLAAPMHPVRVHIPPYMQTAPMLAPGGGAEVLPAGLLNNSISPPPGSSWYANSGFTSLQDFSPISIHQSRRAQPSSQPASSSLVDHNHGQTQSPFDYDAYSSTTAATRTATDSPSATVDGSSETSKALNFCISQGYINPANPISPSQLSALGFSPSTTTSSSGLNAPSSLGLPVYSASGFDLLSIMARVATRPDPKVILGPVDVTSSFVVVDVRRHDSPVIYVSPTFCRLTGYDEGEVIGRNCRFLQSPDGRQAKGEVRQYTSHEAVKHLKKHIMADKECQTSIINYKKNGDAFINLVTVIPIRGGELLGGDDDKVIYHVGFQVDLTEQPNAILNKLKDGTYIVNYSANNPVAVPPLNSLNVLGRLFQNRQSGSGLSLGLGLHAISAKDRKLHSIAQPAISRDLKKLLEEPEFLKSFPITTCTNADATLPFTANSSAPPSADVTGEENGDSSAVSSPKSPTNTPASPTAPSSQPPSMIVPSSTPHTPSANHPLSLILLEYNPDFLHVVSLKGAFLYVAPAVRRVLGYEPWELVGRSLVDICHPSDSVPLMRELKESSSANTGSGGGASVDENNSTDEMASSPTTDTMAVARPRTVDLLFRARTKNGRYVWVECRGRLHVEPGKGRKAILLSGRAKEMAALKWEVVKEVSGGIRECDVVKRLVNTSEKETWGANKDGGGSGRKRKGKKKGGVDDDDGHSSTPPLVAEEVEVKTEFWGAITRSGILLVVTSGVKDVLGYEENELVGRRIETIIADERDKKSVTEEVGKVAACVSSSLSPGGGSMMGVRGAVCGMVRKKGGSEEEAVVQAEVILYPSAMDDTIYQSDQTISPANVIFQIRAHSPVISPGHQNEIHPSPRRSSAISALGAESRHHGTFDDMPSGGIGVSFNDQFGFGAGTIRSGNPRATEGFKADVMHPLDEDVFQPLDTNRGSSWQYELQQLRFANDRLKEEIKVLEGELEKKVTINPTRRNTSPSLSSSSTTSGTLQGAENEGAPPPQSRQLYGENTPQGQRHYIHFLQPPPTSTSADSSRTPESTAVNQAGTGSTQYTTNPSLVYDQQQTMQSAPRVTRQVHQDVHHLGIGSRFTVSTRSSAAYESEAQPQAYGVGSDYPPEPDWRSTNVGRYLPPGLGQTTPVATNLPMPYYIQTQNSHPIRYQPPTPSSLKRNWADMA
ncbi:hypothetical protein E1B28_007146 [Marasmius oreades]|uniref:PAS domain-containing protein n=1 Tax=Marasmius oreades TaxID=181124 RepID=A0A9P7UTR1_9AGAR|nr:uncharacterized protein E1B28_007146 [Marasmius oreades]KAG7093470.1 hypothetical protein E1B28_007146 [Marasmius oreades]